MLKSSLGRLGRRAFDVTGNVLLRPPRSGFGYFRNHGPRDRKRVALTFDDGPNQPSSERLLDALGEMGVPATFFCVGVNVERAPQIVRRAFEAGHDIGSHSMEHRRECALRLSGSSHIDSASRLLEQTLGARPLLYRPPWGWLTPWEGKRLSERGYTVVGWDVFTLDWVTPPPPGERLAHEARRRVKPGSIVLFHDGRPFQPSWQAEETLAAVRRLVPPLRDAGYEFVTASNLLGVPAYAPLT